jgi:hypothetical protein
MFIRLLYESLQVTVMLAILTLAGQIEGFGALKNIAPTYTRISNFPTTKDTRIILPALGATGKMGNSKS